MMWSRTIHSAITKLKKKKKKNSTTGTNRRVSILCHFIPFLTLAVACYIFAASFLNLRNSCQQAPGGGGGGGVVSNYPLASALLVISLTLKSVRWPNVPQTQWDKNTVELIAISSALRLFGIWNASHLVNKEHIHSASRSRSEWSQTPAGWW